MRKIFNGQNMRMETTLFETGNLARVLQGLREISQAADRSRVPQVSVALGEYASVYTWASLENALAIITPNEVCDRHGTGVIMQRCFGARSDVISIRTRDLYNEHTFGQTRIRISYEGLTRSQAYDKLLKILAGQAVSQAICIPYFDDELLTALILKDAFGAKLCLYVMDDNHLFGTGISECLMREALEKADLRLAISPEMRDAYETKFRRKFWLRPPVVTPESIRTKALALPDGILQQQKGLLVGTLWSTQVLEWLAEVVRGAGLMLDWFGNSGASWLDFRPADLISAGIRPCGFIPEQELADKLLEYAFALVPSGTLEANDQRADIARYSLPTRMPFLLAVGNIPTIVLGSRRTAAARFVERLGIGLVVDYNSSQLKAAVDKVCVPEEQMRLREIAAHYAPSFSAEGVGDWILQSLDRGEPITWDLETLMASAPRDHATYVEPPVPPEVLEDFEALYSGLRRLKNKGFNPEFIVDVGASTGIWTTTVQKLFPEARFILIEPLLEIYKERYAYLQDLARHLEFVPMAVSNQAGSARFQISEDLYGSSLVSVPHEAINRVVEVPITTLDQLQEELKIRGRGLIKLDVQFAEHLAIEGGHRLLKQVDALIIELTLPRLAPEAKTFDEMIELVKALGFFYCDDVGEWRSPDDGSLVQKDVLFVRGAFSAGGGREPTNR
jgi:FkbM family methyltransferase